MHAKARFYRNPEAILTDPNSFARLQSQRVSHFHLDLACDFERSILFGRAELKMDFIRSSNSVVLDVNHLSISCVTLTGQDGNLQFKVDQLSALGARLSIKLPSAQVAGSSCVVVIEYATTPSSSALQWLPPSQTLGKQHPYVFTQCQAIHARSVMPCQDTPAAKCTYSARLVVPSPLTALMSALSTRHEPVGDAKQVAFYFEQKVPIPSYLLALAVGCLEKRDISPRCAVWSEKEAADKARFEFEDTERFLAIAEEICGPYAWGRYDILLMPPSFPYGGMENPCLTFVTPTLLAGDKSLANVVAHEIAHSWMGNLVGCETWEHFWMNEGFTVYLERKICKALHGSAAMHLEAITGWNSLIGSVNAYGCCHKFTELHVNLKGCDPDDAFSSIPYEKGFNFLFYLESIVGEAAMNGFLKAHCAEYAFKTTNCFKWKKFFLAHFASLGSALDQIEWDQWLHAPGLPPLPKFDTSLCDEAHKLAAALAMGETAPEEVCLSAWSSARQVAFLEKLLTLQSECKNATEFVPVLTGIESRFQLSASKNAEVRFRYLTLGVRAGLRGSVFADAVKFLTEQGRMKFIRPLYRDLFKAGEEGKALALATFQEHKSMYHAIARTMVSKDLGLQEGAISVNAIP